MDTKRLGLALAAAAFITCLGSARPAHALDCVADAVTVTGEPARYQWLALVKARANWRRRVRLNPNLGDRYANWYRAQDGVERCVSANAGVACTLSGRPCAP